MSFETSFYADLLPWLLATPLVLWLLPRAWAPSALVAVGAGFLLQASPPSALVLGCITIAVLYAVVWAPSATARAASIALIVCGFIAYRSLGAAAESPLALVGLAFYTMRALHLLLDASLESVGATPSVGSAVAWLWFQPTLLVGPINRFDEFERELRRRRWDPSLVAEGAERLLIGSFKIVVVAGFLVSKKLGLYVESLDPDMRLFHVLATLEYALTLYFMFSGFSDLAVGGARLLGMRIQENFDHPYRAANPADFWRRWHISLSEWCRKYVHMRVFATTRRAAPAAISAMLVLGLWHEFSLRYLAWAMWHGVGIAVWQRWSRSRAARQLNEGRLRVPWHICSIALTQTYVISSFVFTSSESLADAVVRWMILLRW